MQHWRWWAVLLGKIGGDGTDEVAVFGRLKRMVSIFPFLSQGLCLFRTVFPRAFGIGNVGVDFRSRRSGVALWFLLFRHDRRMEV